MLGNIGESGTPKGGKMNKIKLHKSEGYAKFNAKRQGLFITHKKGVYKDKETEKEHPYHKVRLTQIFQHKGKKDKGISMSLQRPYRFISFDVDMLKNVAKLLGAIHEEIFGEPLYGGEIKEVKPEPEERDEAGELMAQLGMGRK